MFTCKVYGYETLEHYYHDSSSANYVQDIWVPAFFLNSLDDPISSWRAIPFEKFGRNEFIFLGTTKSGGHNSWYDRYTSVKTWFTTPVFGFLEAVRNKHDTDKKSFI